MKLSKVAVALIALLALIFVVTGCGPQVKVDDPDKFLKDARQLVTKANAEKSSVTRDADYQKAIEKYNAVAGQYKDKPQGAVALSELGTLYETAKGKTKSDQQAYNEFSNLLVRFDKKRAELTQRGLLPNEITEIESLVAQAKTKKTELATKLDDYNRTHPLWGIFNLYAVMSFLVHLTGAVPAFSYWFAIVLITIVVKLVLTPLTKAQFKAMKEMQKVAPLVKEIQEKYKGDQTTIGTKTMELYKEHHINPFASCLPLLIQMPILLLLYRTISTYQFQFQKGMFLWIGSGLSHATYVTPPTGGGAPVWVTARNLAEPDLILVIIYAISMYVSTKLSNVDPTQAEQQKMMSIMMPIMFAVLFAGFQSAFLLYWLVFNILQTVQQYFILYKHGEPVPETGPAPQPDQPTDESQRRPRRRRRR